VGVNVAVAVGGTGVAVGIGVAVGTAVRVAGGTRVGVGVGVPQPAQTNASINTKTQNPIGLNIFSSLDALREVKIANAPAEQGTLATVGMTDGRAERTSPTRLDVRRVITPAIFDLPRLYYGLADPSIP